MSRLRILGCALVLLAGACAPGPRSLRGPLRQQAEAQLGAGRWQDALRTCRAVLRRNPDDCPARYCELIGHTMVFVDQVNDYVLPRYRTGSGRAGLGDFFNLLKARRQLGRAERAVEETAARGCELDVPRVPLRIGAPQALLLDGEVRGVWTARDAHLLGAIFTAFHYLFDALLGHPKVPPSPPGEAVPGLPALLARMKRHLEAHDRLLFARPASPTALRGGWHDRDGDGVPSPGDELLVDIFRPGTSERLLDFSQADFVRGESLPAGALTKTADLPRARCGYRRWHIDTVRAGKDVGSTDGMSFSPDGRRLVVPIKKDGRFQVHVMDAGGGAATCLTCGSPGSSDGVRWQPGGDLLIFVSDRDHPFGLGNAGGGAGQELYAMRSDGSQVTRLTRSHDWATNYHANFSMDGRRLAWGTTEGRTWDVMVADLVADAAGPRLENVRRLTHDTTWWETHGFSKDGRAVITSNTRAGLLSSDLYAIDIESGRRTRLTTDPAWDEHAHLSPDGRKLAWISGRFRRAGVQRLTTLSPVQDYFWIVPGIFFVLLNHPAGYATELTLMDADGQNLQRLTSDGEIVADNEWSPDGRRIVFRQFEPAVFAPGKIRVLTFDDCE
jgi:TolB protein